MGLHDFTSFPAVLQPTSLWGPGAALPRLRGCDLTLWGQLQAGVLPWQLPEAAVQLAMCGFSDQGRVQITHKIILLLPTQL